jgi:hypothetical protein
MGWTYGYAWTRRQYLVDEVTKSWESEQHTFECIAKKFAGNDLWTVWERSARQACKLAPRPYRQFQGELYAQTVAEFESQRQTTEETCLQQVISTACEQTDLATQ